MRPFRGWPPDEQSGISISTTTHISGLVAVLYMICRTTHQSP
jgi:hypothetical protein